MLTRKPCSSQMDKDPGNLPAPLLPPFWKDPANLPAPLIPPFRKEPAPHSDQQGPRQNSPVPLGPRLHACLVPVMKTKTKGSWERRPQTGGLRGSSRLS